MADTVRKPFNFKRLVVAAVVLPLLILFIHYSPHYPHFFILLLAVSLLALREFYAMYKVPLRLSIAALVTGALLFIVMCSYPYYIIDAVFISFFILLLIRLFFAGSPSGAMSELGPVAAGYLYILGFMVFQWLLRNDASGRYNIFLLYASVWLADSFAYYIGSYLGSHKLCPELSPNKTYEGAVGSLIGGAAGAMAVTSIYGFQESSLFRAMVTGAVIGLVTIMGDLVESMFKRDAGVKDSGSLFPGHGGILDKLDGVLVAGPVLYFMMRFF
jgi:phosphatidate cytidylyltransferase